MTFGKIGIAVLVLAVGAAALPARGGAASGDDTSTSHCAPACSSTASW